MRPARFTLHRPESLAHALALKAEFGDAATFHAGGTELLVALKARVLRYEHVIDIKRISDLREIRVRSDGVLSIGALCTHHQIARSPVVQDRLPGYAHLSEHVANIRVRVAGTLGGVLCFAEPHADAPTLLCALDAWVVLAAADGEREVPSRDFHLGEFSTVRRDHEILASIEIAPRSDATRCAYRCFGHTERPAVGVAAVWSADDTQRLSLWAGAITGSPQRLGRAEEAAGALAPGLGGAAIWDALSPAVAADAQALEARDDLHGGADYKRHLVSVLARRAIEACLP